jgi:soluble lytic murein transglycosylase-like protein
VRTVVAAIFAALIVSLLPPVALADIYQYTDANGVLHFTNVTGGKNHKRVSPGPRQKIQPEACPVPQETTPSKNTISSANMPSAYLDIIQTACNRHGVDPALVHALVKVESDFNPYALSRKGAMGLMQLMPQTALDMNVQNSFSPNENVDGGVKYLRYLIDRYEGNLSLALAAYNSGETAVKKWGTIPPFKETQNYVQRVLKLYNGKNKLHIPRYTIYMGYTEDGSLIVTDTPQPGRNKTARKDL